MKKLGAITFAVLLIAAYLVGYLPQHNQLTTSENALQSTRRQLADVREQVNICHLENQLLDVIKEVDNNNFGQAQQHSTDFFNAVRGQMTQSTKPNYKSALQSVLEMRDSIMIALSRKDPSSSHMLSQALEQLRSPLDPFPSPAN